MLVIARINASNMQAIYAQITLARSIDPRMSELSAPHRDDQPGHGAEKLCGSDRGIYLEASQVFHRVPWAQGRLDPPCLEQTGLMSWNEALGMNGAENTGTPVERATSLSRYQQDILWHSMSELSHSQSLI